MPAANSGLCSPSSADVPYRRPLCRARGMARATNTSGPGAPYPESATSHEHPRFSCLAPPQRVHFGPNSDIDTICFRTTADRLFLGGQSGVRSHRTARGSGGFGRRFREPLRYLRGDGRLAKVARTVDPDPGSSPALARSMGLSFAIGMGLTSSLRSGRRKRNHDAAFRPLQ